MLCVIFLSVVAPWQAPVAESMEHWTSTFGGQSHLLKKPSPIFSQIQPFATSMSEIAIVEKMNGMEQNGTG
jgi:hypothetical protein